MLMVEALVRTHMPLAILGCSFAKLEKHELCCNVLQEVPREIVRLEVTSGSSSLRSTGFEVFPASHSGLRVAVMNLDCGVRTSV